MCKGNGDSPSTVIGKRGRTRAKVLVVGWGIQLGLHSDDVGGAGMTRHGSKERCGTWLVGLPFLD